MLHRANGDRNTNRYTHRQPSFSLFEWHLLRRWKFKSSVNKESSKKEKAMIYEYMIYYDVWEKVWHVYDNIWHVRWKYMTVRWKYMTSGHPIRVTVYQHRRHENRLSESKNIWSIFNGKLRSKCSSKTKISKLPIPYYFLLDETSKDLNVVPTFTTFTHKYFFFQHDDHILCFKNGKIFIRIYELQHYYNYIYNHFAVILKLHM